MISYSISSPFWYSPEPQDSGKPIPTPEGKEAMGRLSPCENATEIMQDVNRELRKTKIKYKVGEKTVEKSYLELRAEEADLTQMEKRIVLFTDEQILDLKPTMKPDDFKELKERRHQLLTEKIHFKINKDVKELTQEIDPLKYFKDFLKKHLLQKITSPAKQEYLADTIAHNSHQNGVVAALPAYFDKRISPLLQEQFFYGDHLDLFIMQISNPERNLVISCEDGVVTLSPSVKYNTLTATRGVKKDGSPNTLVDAHKRLDNKPLIEVNSTIYITASRQGGKNPTYDLDVHSDDLHVNRAFLFTEQGREFTHLNQFLSKSFSDQPLYTSAGIFLQKNRPKAEECQPNAMYICIEGNTPRYYTKINGAMITGKVPAHIKNIELNRDTVSQLKKIAPETPTRLETLVAAPKTKQLFVEEKKKLASRLKNRFTKKAAERTLGYKQNALQTLALAVFNIDPKPEPPTKSLLSRLFFTNKAAPAPTKKTNQKPGSPTAVPTNASPRK